LLFAIKIVAIISMILSFAGMLYSAKNWIELMDNVLPEKKKWLYINPFLILNKNYLTDNGEKLKNKVVRGFIILLIGALFFLVMYGLRISYWP